MEEIAEADRRQDPRPTEELSIGGIKTRALVDSGATISAMAATLFRSIPASEILSKEYSPGLRITAASNQKMSLVGVYTVRMSNEKLGTFQWPLAVMESMASDVILGVDFLSEFEATIQVKKKEVKYAAIPRTGTVRAQTTVKVAPYSWKKVNGRASTESRGGFSVTIPRNEAVMAGIQEWRARNGAYEVILHNGGPEWLVVERGERLADYWQTEEEEICTTEAFSRCRPANRERKPLSRAKQEMIRMAIREELGPEFRKRLIEIMEQNHEAVSEDSADLGRTAAVEHKLVQKSEKQIYRKQFPLPTAHQDFINKTVEDLLKIGAIKEDMASPHNTPIFAVKKPHSNDLRLVQDLRALNENVENFLHPILDIPSCMAKLGGLKAKYFAAIDLTSGFYQLELDPSSQPLTAFTVPGKGRFSWTVSTMGLKTSPGAFSRLMEHVMQPVKRAVTYMDDVILAGSTPEELLESIEEAMSQLRKFNLKINLKKCTFGTKEVDYLGYRISAEGAKPGKEKTEAVVNFPAPTSVQEVRRFLGMANYFRSHIRHFSQLTQPLTKLTRKDSTWIEGEELPKEARQAFEKIRKALASEPVTALPRPNLPFTLETDGSGEGLGACLKQLQDGKEKVIGYASRALQEHERNYPAFVLEQAAAVFGIENFSQHLTGAQFDLIVDHKPLLALSTVHKKTLARLQQLMNEYTFQLRYRSGQENAVADALSRAPVEAIADSHEELQRLQDEDTFCRTAKAMCEKGQIPENGDPGAIKLLRKIVTQCLVKDGCVYMKTENPPEPPRELWLTPQKCRYELVRAAHAGRFSGHGGEAKTLARLKQTYFWPGMAGDVAEFVKRCDVCQRAKDPPAFARQRAPLQPLEVPDAPNIRLHLDLFAVPRTSAAGNKYVLVATDAFSKWVELVAIPEKSAEVVAEAVFNRWICRFACPREVVTDRGREFCSRLSEELWRRLDVAHKKTSAYHPQTNTSAESFNRTLIRILRALLDDPDGDWETLLPVVMLTYNTRVHSSTRASPFFLTYLRDPALPYFDLDEHRPLYGESWAANALERMREVQRIAKESMEKAQTIGKERYDDKLKGNLRTFQPGDEVWVKFDPMSFPKIRNKKFIRQWLPHRVVRVITPTTYSVTAVEPGRGHGKTSTVHVNRIKRRWREEQEDEEEAGESEAFTQNERESESGEREREEAEDEEGAIVPEEPREEEAEARAEQEEMQEERQAGRLTRARARERGVHVDPRLSPPRVPLEYRRGGGEELNYVGRSVAGVRGSNGSGDLPTER
jgi:transposase InsO family protein